ncbi:MAG: isoprenyl transferase [Candidatus Cloacimonetes bacterium]|nr:isoprenyl transferase [Candidatus Cloacimonadota bacterium]MBL7085478.1 isoprenyl transferase [Candidatus Cloacimonadota bacterium]
MKTKEELIRKVKKGLIPSHIAIIMDGNGRWAKLRGLSRIKGHQAGVEAVRGVVDTSGHLGIKYLTLYAFSTENWRRPEKEAKAVLTLIENTLIREINNLAKNNVIVHFIGSQKDLSKRFIKKINDSYQRTKNNTGLNLILAINYGGRNEILEAVEKMLQKQINKLTIDEFSNYLYTSKFPDPDLVIRTSGVIRLSNFLIWQTAYSELWFTDTLWPDFTPEEYMQAILDFQKRTRKFGGVK